MRMGVEGASPCKISVIRDWVRRINWSGVNILAAWIMSSKQTTVVMVDLNP
jgi:hypothetical protein